MAKGNDDEIFDHSRRGMFFQRAPQIRRRILCAYAALRFNRKAPNPVVSRSRNDKQKLILKKNYARSVSFRPLARTFLAAHADDFTTSLFWLVHLRFETMAHGGDLVVLRTSKSRLRLTLRYCRQRPRQIFCSEMALIGMTEVQAERPPSCENCGCATVKVGKLSRLGSRPLINVYKCQPCRQIISITTAPFISDLRFRPEDVRSRE